MKTRIMLAGLAAVTMTAVGTTTASARIATDTSNKTVTLDCIDATTGEDQGDFVWSGPTASWPPNHKDKSATVTLFDQDDESAADAVTIEVVGMHDEATYDDNGVATGEENGAGKTDPVTDARGGAGSGTESAATDVFWRSERSGRGDGRTYTFTASGTVDGITEPLPATATCEPVAFTVEVPHDQGQGSGKPATRKKSKRSLRRAR